MHLSQIGMALGRVMVFAFSITAMGDAVARAESWKPALKDANELADAAEDLHARARRLGDPRVVPVTADFEHLTRQLYYQLKHNACAADVVPLVETTGAVLSEVVARVKLSCDTHTDRKSMAELNNARRYFAATHDEIHCLVDHHDHHWGGVPFSGSDPTLYQPAGHLPVIKQPVVSQPTFSQPTFNVPTFNLQGSRQAAGHQPVGRGLPRVMLRSF